MSAIMGMYHTIDLTKGPVVSNGAVCPAMEDGA